MTSRGEKDDPTGRAAPLLASQGHLPGEGGDLRLFETRFTDGRYVATDRSERVPAIRNRVVFFPSLLEHEVMEVTCPSGHFADSRFAINGWVHD